MTLLRPPAPLALALALLAFAAPAAANLSPVSAGPVRSRLPVPTGSCQAHLSPFVAGPACARVPPVPNAAQLPPPKPATPPSDAWARTGPVGTPAAGVTQPAIVFAAPGRALIGWTSLSADTGGRGRIAAWAPGSEPVVDRGLLAGDLATAPVPLGGGRALLVVERPTRHVPETLGQVRLRTAVRSASGRIGRWRDVARYTSAGATAAAISRTGEVALAWVEHRAPPRGEDAATYRLRLAVRPRGRRFRAPVTAANLGPIEHPGYVTVALAYDSAGRLVVAAPENRSVRRVLSLTGRPGALRRQRLGPDRGVTDVVAAISRSGRAVVAWATQDGGEEANQPQVVRAAVRERGARRFGRGRVVDPGDARSRAPGRIALAVGRDGAAVLTWSQVRGAGFPFRHPVVVASAPAGGRFGAPVELDADGAASDVAIGGDGRAVVVWSRILRGNEQEPDQVFAAMRAPGEAAFGAPEAVSAADVATRPSAAFDPATGRPVVVWSERPGDAPPPEEGGGADAVVRAAVRSAG